MTTKAKKPGPKGANNKVVDLRGTPCDEFLSELQHHMGEMFRTGMSVGFNISRGQSLFLALGAFGTDPVLGPYTITPDSTFCDYELCCDADPAAIAAYQVDWSNVVQAYQALSMQRVPNPPTRLEATRD